MAKLSFIVRKTESKFGFPLQLQISFAGKRIRYSTDVYVSDPKNFANGQVSPQETNAKAKNVKLSRMTSALEMFLVEKHTLSELKSFLKYLVSDTEKEERLLTDVLDEFVSMKSNPSTLTMYGITKKKIIAYNPKATLETVDRKWLAGIERMMSESGMSINGLAIHLRNIRAVFNYALDEEYTTNYPFRKFKIKQEKTAKRALTFEQLVKIRDCDCEEFQKIHRDMFMLMFYLIGINAADLFSLPTDAINEQSRIVYHRAKTGKLYNIKVEPEALAIINKYRGKKWLISPLDSYKSYKDYIHHMNNSLKTLGRQWKLGVGWTGDAICPDLTGYWSRHTWATIAFSIGVPKDIISLALGHSFGLSVTDIYIDYSSTQVDEANRKVLDFLQGISL